jgi:hypothetical protein
VTPYNKVGWQRFIAADPEISRIPDGPFGFGETELDAMENLTADPYYRRLLALRPPVPPSE